MTDQTMPADKVRELVDGMRESMRRAENTCRDVEFLDDMSVYIEDLASLLPPPPRPTLADMTREERCACRWMQADVENRSVRYVIVVPFDDEAETGLVSADGVIGWAPSDRITPRPDLPRMMWPGNKKPMPAPALPGRWRFADHPDHGRVIVTKTTPDSDGRVYVVRPAAGPLGHACYFCTPDELTYLDQEVDQ